MKKVATEIEKLSIDGDIVEFGAWDGVGLHLIDMAFQKKTDRMLIGVEKFCSTNLTRYFKLSFE